jgi:hypothetical protein
MSPAKQQNQQPTRPNELVEPPSILPRMEKSAAATAKQEQRDATARWLSCWTATAKAGLDETRRRLWRLYHRGRRSCRRRSSWWRTRRRTVWCRGARRGTASWCGTRTPSRRGSSPAASSTPTSPPSSGSSTHTYVIECAAHYCSSLPY